MLYQIDINCDLGEGYGIEEAIAPYISSANIACGGHAGDIETMRQTINIAKKYDIAVGAHPSYPDTENFGRTILDLPWNELKKSIREQIIQLKNLVNEEGLSLHHVKLHGALYNKAAVDKNLASGIAELIKELDRSLLLYGPPLSELEIAAAQQNLSFVREGFADRTYQENGQLTPRTMSNALIENESACVNQALSMIRESQVTSVTGKAVPLPVQTICLHGDGKKAIAFAQSLVKELSKHQIEIIAPQR